METCRQYLAAHDWDVERAIETALISDIDPPSTPIDNPRTTTDYFPSAPPMPEPEINVDPSSVERPNNQPIHPILYVKDIRTSIVVSFKEISFRQILRLPLTFLYALYSIIAPFLPWPIIHFITSFSKKLMTKKFY